MWDEKEHLRRITKVGIVDKIEVLRKKYRKQLVAVKIFEGIEEHLSTLREDIDEISKVSHSYIQLSEDGPRNLLITLDDKRARISLKDASNVISCERLEPSVEAAITYVVEDENSLSSHSPGYPSPQEVPLDKTSPEALLDHILKELFFDVTSK
nr:hypothetical protein [Bacillus velezensis]